MSGIIPSMNSILIAKKSIKYEVATPLFEGPLDLLLTLIERAELDITKLALAAVTDQYLAYIKKITETQASDISDFIVIAAKLIQIKSEALLPRQPDRVDLEEDPGEALARQLILYKQYRSIAQQLYQVEALGYRTHLRTATPPSIQARVDFSDVNIDDLAILASKLLYNIDRREELKTVVTPSPITIRQKIKLISNALRHSNRTTFRALLSHHNRLNITVTFLAVLELIKQHFIQAYQTTIFGEIELEMTGDLDELDYLELEFGE